VDSELLRDAIALTHPDRHAAARARLAITVTARLLELPDEARTAV
jgi:hypothetical protein